jgi:hypothetical protein
VVPGVGVAELAALIDPAAEIAYRHRLEREAYERGRARGWCEGYERAEADMARRWDQIAGPVSRGGPAYAELEVLRWGAGGPEHFADPRPGDYVPRSRAA